MALCSSCRREIADPHNRRHGYAFTNCTQCGPRYTIIEALPYDRRQTTMGRFAMCGECRAEYVDRRRRRFHAEPIACPVCGPQLRTLNGTGELVDGNPLRAAALALSRGRVVAIKSLGGFQLSCDATSDRSVSRLRRLKERPTKPLAVMCDSVGAATLFSDVSSGARRLLQSSAAPVVLVPRAANPRLRLSEAIAPGNNRVGVMLPYTPLHFLLFKALVDIRRKPWVLVMTSGNRHDEPLLSDERSLLSALPGAVDLTLTHDRPIANRCDDSVVHPDCPAVIVRRARGYAPAPVDLGPVFHVKHPVLGVGAESKNCFALASGRAAYLSPHIGDLGTDAGAGFWFDTLKRYMRWAKTKPSVVVCDLHPDYATTRLGERLARESGAQLVRIQHHVAHAFSVIAEHGIGEPTLAVVCDGYGYGTDGAMWGCEFLLVNPDLSWTRAGHLAYMVSPDVGVELADPSAVAAAYLEQASMGDLLRRLGLRRTGLASSAAGRTSSLGRLFDAVAGTSGVCRHASHEGEAAAALESAADLSSGSYRWDRMLSESAGVLELNPIPLLVAVAEDCVRSGSAARVAGKFHRAVAGAIVEAARVLSRRARIGVVCLSGGSFQNTFLRRFVGRSLRASGLRVCINSVVPVNDGGLALGQVLAASDHAMASRLRNMVP